MMTDWIETLPSAWKGHRSFSEWLVTYLRPQTVVELGVDYGYSSFCFATALQKNRRGKIYSIDNFQGDKHTSFRNTKQIVVNHMNSHQLNHMEIIEKDFDTVAKTWNMPIDILHIDGLHTYEAIKNDYLTWSRFVKNSGVILLHDVCVYHSDFGVHKFFGEINENKLYFEHSSGLGIISKNKELMDIIKETYPECKTKEVEKIKLKLKNI